MKNYYQASAQTEIKSSRYAFGLDYHEVIKEKMRALIATMQAEWGMFEHRSFVDSAPVLERAWARNSGLGWVGKNSMLIHPKAGSNYFLAVIILDVELRYDDPLAKDYCGSCQRCIDACPTDAIVSPKVVDARKCISYLSIELKGEMPTNAPAYDSWVFGCDVCQDVCPWNRFSTTHTEPLFQPHDDLLSLTKKEWANLSDEYFQELFKKSAVKRTKKSGLDRNIDFVQKYKK
jgi:epoxyqueuosine reductase